jgi:AcrR family transcriptional regulator
MGLRDLKKQQTRTLIADTAMGLFMKRGFDHVTVAEVAEAAGVSEKTVFNYFHSKEDLFFDEVDEREAALVEAIRDRRPGESVLAALRRSQLAGCGRMCSEGFAGFARLIESSQALRAKELEVMARLAATLADTLQDELGCDDLDAKVAASLIVGVHWQFFAIARQRALAGRHGPAATRRLRADLARAYELLESGLGDLGSRKLGADLQPA